MENQKILLEILRKFVHMESAAPSLEGMHAGDWREVLLLAQEHAVLPMVYEVVGKEKAFQTVPEEIRKEYKKLVAGMVVRQVRATGLFLQLYQEILESGVTPLVMKGIICRNMYRMPDYRISGDEDLLVRREEFAKLDLFLQERGFQRDEIEDMEREHEVTYVHGKNGMRLEVHLDLFPEQSGSYGFLNEEFPEVFERHIVQRIQGVEVHTLSETQHMLYLLCHGLKHFLHSGFGIRQLCDMIVYAETYGAHIDWAEIEERTKRQGMYVFWMNLFDIGERYLGFSWDKALLKRPEGLELDSEELLEDILDSGIFGKSSRQRLHSANMTLEASNRKEKKRSEMMASLFPGMEYMRARYPYLKEKKWLLPAAWLQRIFSYGKKMRGREMTGAAKIGMQRVKLLEKYGIVERKS